MFRQFVIFYGLYAVLQLRCLLGAFVYVHADTADLVSSMGKLQQEARRVLASLDPGLQPRNVLDRLARLVCALPDGFQHPSSP